VNGKGIKMGMRCSKCGGYLGNSFYCAACSAVDAIQENTNTLLRLNEINEYNRQRETQRYQLEQRAREAAEKQNFNLILGEQTKQTNLLYEQLITEEEAYRQGYDWDTINLPDLRITNQNISKSHSLIISFDFEGHIFIDELSPDYVSPILARAYISGVKDRLEQDFSKKLDSQILKELAYKTGWNALAKGAFLPNSQPIFYEHSLTLKTDNGRTSKQFVIYGYDISPKMKWGTNLDTGEVFIRPVIKSIIPNIDQNISFFAGVYGYVDSINDETSCARRLAKYNSDYTKYEKAKARKESTQKAYITAGKFFVIRHRVKLVAEFSFKLFFVSFLVFLVYAGFWYIALLLPIFVGKTVMTFRFSRSIEKEEKLLREFEDIYVPPVLDPINISSRLY